MPKSHAARPAARPRPRRTTGVGRGGRANPDSPPAVQPAGRRQARQPAPAGPPADPEGVQEPLVRLQKVAGRLETAVHDPATDRRALAALAREFRMTLE